MSDRHAAQLEQALGATADCVPIERFAATLSERDKQHVDSCARCQSELALWREFEESRPTADDGAAVSWIVAELARRRQAAPSWTVRTLFAWPMMPLGRWAAAVAAIVLVAAGAYLVWDREPAVRDFSNAPQVYRTGRLDIRAPSGDLAAAPTSLEWVAPDRAVGYDVTVFEVDRTPLWRATSPVARVELPASVVRLFVPGKSILWEVQARNAANQVIAESGTQRFRVAVPGGSPRD